MNQALNKKILPWVLTLAMILSVWTMPIFADDQGKDLTEEYVNGSELIAEFIEIEVTSSEPLDPTKPISLRVDLHKIPVPGDASRPFIIEDGDYINVPLSDNFRLSDDTTKEYTITSPDGRQVALVTLENSPVTDEFGTTTYSLTAHVEFRGDAGNSIYDDEDAGRVSAWFNLDLEYDAEGGETEDGMTYTIKILDKEYNLFYPPTYILAKSVVKTESGEDIDFEKQTITWKVEITGTAKDGRPLPLEGYTFEDDLTNVGDYVDESFMIGADEESLTAVTPTGIDPALTYTFGETDVTPKTITFKTKLRSADLYKNGKISVDNTAKLMDDDGEKVDDDLATATGGNDSDKWIDKIVSQTVGSGGKINLDGTITWTVTVDPRGTTLENAYILEEFPAGLKTIAGDPVTLDATFKIGDTTLTTAENPSGQYFKQTDAQTATIGAKYEIYLGDINTEQTLTITAKVDPDTIFTGQKTYTNKATLYFDQYPGGIGTGNVNVGIGANIIGKEHIERDDAKGIVTWQVNVNRQDQVKVTDPVAYDVLVYGSSLNLNGTGITVTGGSPEENSKVLAAIRDAKATKSVYQKYVSNSASMVTGTTGLGFKVYTVKQGETPVADVLVTTGFASIGTSSYQFQTQLLDITKILNSNRTAYRNYVHLFNNGTDYLSSADASGSYSDNWLVKEALTRAGALAFKAEQTAENANMSSTSANAIFNYDDKSVVFRLVVDAKKLDLEHLEEAMDLTGTFTATLTDTLPKGWKFLPLNGESGPVYKIFNFDGTGATGDGVTNIVTEAPIIEGTSTEGETITFSFDVTAADLDAEAYVIVLRAGPDEKTQEAFFSENHTNGVDFTNRANLQLKWGDVGTSFTDTQKITLKNTVLDKKNASKANGVLTWTVDYNPVGIEWPVVAPDEIYLEDTLPNELKLRLDSNGNPLLEEEDGTPVISIQEITVDNAGDTALSGTKRAVTEDEISYRFDEEKGKFILIFHIPNDGNAYRFTYQTKIVGDPSATPVKNTIALMGKTGDGGSTQGSYQIVSEDSGAMVSYFGRVEITKLDGGNNGPIQNVLFELRGQNGNLIQVGSTGADGKLVLRGLDPGTYTLQERTPDDYDEIGKIYQVVVEKVNDKMVTSISGQTGDDSYKITVKNYQTGTVGDLKISKKIAGNGADGQKAFSFTIRLTGVSGDYEIIRSDGNGGKEEDTLTFNSGVATFNLKGGESIIIKNLPQGTPYIVTEADYWNEYYTTEMDGDEGTIAANEVKEASFTNTKEVGELTISKTLEGAAADPDDVFNFTIALVGVEEVVADVTGKFDYVGGGGKADGTITFNSEGIAEITLRGGESITIKDLPAHVLYTVTEDDYRSEGYSTKSTGETGSIEANEEQVASFTNSRIGWIEITKVDAADNEPLAGAEFTLYEEDDVTFANGISVGTTDDDGKLWLLDLGPGTYILKETKTPTGYNLHEKTYTIVVEETDDGIVTSIAGQTGDDSNKIELVNYQTGTVGDLVISKSLSGNATDSRKEFSFTVTVEAAAGKTYEYLGSGGKADDTFTFDDSGSYTFTLKGGESIRIKYLPAGVAYTVTEDDYKKDGYSTIATNAAGEILADNVQTASFVNRRSRSTSQPEVGSLRVSKTVTGTAGDTSEQFNFTITFGDNGRYSYTGVGVAGGTIRSGDTIALAHGQSITIVDLPAGITYSVEEDDYTAEGYVTSSSNDSGKITADSIETARFTNARDEDPTDPENPGEPTDPGKPGEPTDPGKPGDPDDGSGILPDGDRNNDGKTSVPKTGDNMSMTLWLAIMFGALWAAGLLIRKRKAAADKQ